MKSFPANKISCQAKLGTKDKVRPKEMSGKSDDDFTVSFSGRRLNLS